MKKMNKKQKFSIGRSPDGFGIFKDHETDWVFKRKLGQMNEKAAEIGECLFTANKINEKDGESWIKEWSNLAEKIEKQAETALNNGHKISSRELFLRACNYYSIAEYGTHPNHPRFNELWEKSRNCFHKACPLFEPEIQIIEVPFEGKKLPGYFWRPDISNTKRPTLFGVGGNDSSGEEVVLICGFAAVRRGYNFFTFEFPGHRGTVHLYSDCVKRPDMEIPFKAAFDVLEKLPGVDERIALTGFSFGGYVTSRVAIHEKRVMALIPDSPLIDIYRTQKKMLSLLDSKFPNSLVAKLMDWKVKKSPLMKSMLYYSMWNSGEHDYSGKGIIDAVKNYDYKPWDIRKNLHKINCPALVLVSEKEGEELMIQANEFYNEISSKNKKMHIFSLEKDGSNDHCQLDNRTRGNQIMFDWLDDVFNYRYN